jgi:hypothetical protein
MARQNGGNSHKLPHRKKFYLREWPNEKLLAIKRGQKWGE